MRLLLGSKPCGDLSLPNPPLPPGALLSLYGFLCLFIFFEARSVFPNLLCEVATEESSHLIRTRVSAIEKPAGSEIVKLSVNIELQVGRDGLVGVAL